MKKVIQINIQGLVFHVDEDAHELLQNYLHEVFAYFKHTEHGHEIYDDFEQRLAELLKEKISKSKEAITLDDVEEVITKLGRPEDFDHAQQNSSGTYHARAKRKLYRDPENATFGGVAAGIAAYLHTEVVWIRLAFVLAIFFNGLGIIAYLIMWVIVPKAQTLSQRMEMKGDPLNFDYIEKKIREEYEQVKQNFSNYTTSSAFRESKNVLAQLLHITGRFILLFIKAIAAITGLVLVIGGLFLITGLLLSWFPVPFFWPWEEWQVIPNLTAVLSRLIPAEMITPLLISIWIIILIPILSIIYGGIKLIFRIHAKDQIAGALLFVTWIIAVLFATSITFMQYQHFREENTISEKQMIEQWQADTLHLYTFNHEHINATRQKYLAGPYQIYVSPSETDITGHVHTNIKPSPSGQLEIHLFKSATGETDYDATMNSKQIEYTWRVEGNHLYLDNHFYLKPDAYFRMQEMELEIAVPTGTIVYIDPSLRFIHDHSRPYEENYSAGKNAYWRMTSNGLRSIPEIQ